MFPIDVLDNPKAHSKHLIIFIIENLDENYSRKIIYEFRRLINYNFIVVYNRSDVFMLVDYFNNVEHKGNYELIDIIVYNSPLYAPSKLALLLGNKCRLCAINCYPPIFSYNNAYSFENFPSIIYIGYDISPSTKKIFLEYLKTTKHIKYNSESVYCTKKDIQFSAENMLKLYKFITKNDINSISQELIKVNLLTVSSENQFVFEYNNKYYVFSTPVPWDMVADTAGYWSHNFNKLNFLREMDLDRAYNILKDYHTTKLHEKNKSYKSDHAACERVYTLLYLFERFSNAKANHGMELCVEMIIDHINIINDPQVYQHGCNHGLMSEIALLTIWHSGFGLEKYIDYNNVIKRSLETYDAIFSENGIQKEHSIAYQEWNASYGYKYLTMLAKDPKIAPEADKRLNILKKSTLQFLAAFLTSDNTYFPIGNSSRVPNLKMLPFVDRDLAANPIQCLNTYMVEGVQYWKEGYGSYRHSQSGTHMVFTCGRFSNVHKQDDELSLCLRIGDTTIIDKSATGYMLTPDKYDKFFTAQNHSTMFFESVPWLPRSKDKDINSIIYEPSGELIFHGSHQRVPNYKISRKVYVTHPDNTNVGIKIEDEVVNIGIDSNKKIPPLTHRFILAPNILVLRKDNKLILSKDDMYVAYITIPPNTLINEEKVPYVGIKLPYLSETTCIDFISELQQMTIIFSSINY